jgi:hypothetical protein
LKKSALTLLCAIFAISVFQACKKTGDGSCPEISASVTTPVQAGGTIELSARYTLEVGILDGCTRSNISKEVSRILTRNHLL